MLTDWLQWALFPISLAGQYVVGRKKAYGWLMGLGTQCLWFWFALAIGKPGLLVGTCSYAGLYAYNYFKWKSPERAADFAEWLQWHTAFGERKRKLAADMLTQWGEENQPDAVRPDIEG